MNARAAALCAALAVFGLHAEEDFVIAARSTSTQGAAVNAARIKTLADLFRRSADGDAQAADQFASSSLIERTTSLATMADAGKEELRQKAIAALASLAKLSDGASALEIQAAELARAALTRATINETNPAISAIAREAWKAAVQPDLAAADKGAQQRGKANLAAMAAPLDGENPFPARRAFEGLMGMGGPDALELLVTKIRRTWGPWTHNHIFIGTERAYIADYDISGNSFKPVVRSYMTGVVLDSKVLQVEIVEYIIENLRRMRAEDRVLNDPNQWGDFIRKNR